MSDPYYKKEEYLIITKGSMYKSTILIFNINMCTVKPLFYTDAHVSYYTFVQLLERHIL